MKKILKITMILMVALLVPTLSSCGDDDDDSDQSSSELVGVWAYLDEIEDPYYSSWSAFQFNSDGTGLEGDWDPTKKKFVDVYYELTWSITPSGRLIIYDLDYDDTWISNYFVNGDYLYMWDDDEEVGHDKLKRIK